MNNHNLAISRDGICRQGYSLKALYFSKVITLTIKGEEDSIQAMNICGYNQKLTAPENAPMQYLRFTDTLIPMLLCCGLTCTLPLNR